MICSILLFLFFHLISFLTKFLLILLSIITHFISFFVFNFIFKFNSITTDKNLVRLRDNLISNYATLAVNARQIFNITLQLMNHNVIECGNVVNIPVRIHWFVLSEVIFNDVNLYETLIKKLLLLTR